MAGDTSASSADSGQDGAAGDRPDADDIAASPSPPNEGISSGPSSNRAPSAPILKRRRVTRACDECRRKKIKCDGRQPCTHCTVYSYDCTYDRPSHRRRHHPPQHVEAIEARLHRAESLLRVVAPHLDLNDSRLDELIQQGQALSPTSNSGFVGGSPGTALGQANSLAQNQNHAKEEVTRKDSDLESMVKATGQLDMDERGNWDYHGHSSGVSFIRRLRDRFGDVIGPDQYPQKYGPKARNIQQAFERPKSPNLHTDSPFEGSSVGTDELPSRDVAKRLCHYALDDACAIIPCVHQPTFYASLDRIYDLSMESYQNEDHKFLPLLYCVLSLGCLFADDEDSDLERKGYNTATDEGYRYFWAARQLLDITDCRDLTSLQAVIFMILFLQCSAKLSTCYSFIGVALRSALRLGLHRSFRENFSPIEAECRKRVFWLIRKMDVYVGAMLGLPLTLVEDDIDQDLPTEVDDEFIGVCQVFKMPEGSVSRLVAANANFRLCKIVSKISKRIYPIKGFWHRQHQPWSGCYSVPYATIHEIENELEAWKEDLPESFKPGSDGPPQVIRMQQLLRMAFAHAQMMLYRPFLHYVSTRRQQPPSGRSYACAHVCVSVSQNIIQITTEMKKRGFLVGSYWFTMYTTFFAVLSLVYYTLENPEDAAEQNVMRDAREGKRTLASLAKRSMAADRCSQSLKVLFDQLGDSLAKNLHVGHPAHGTKRGASLSAADEATMADRPPGKRQESGQQPHTHPSLFPDDAAAGSQQPQPQMFGQPEVQMPQPPPASMQQSFPLSVPSNVPTSMRSEPITASTTLPFDTPPLAHISGPGPNQPPSRFQPSQFQNYGYAGSLDNVSAMMFPSADPFAYPNQPMLTLEQNYLAGSGSEVPAQGIPDDAFIHSSTPTTSNNYSLDEDMSVHPFGMMPHSMREEQGGGQQDSNFWHNFVNGTTTGFTTQGINAPISGAQMWNQQARSHGLPGYDVGDMYDPNWMRGMTDS